jgi:hypothetical protein
MESVITLQDAATIVTYVAPGYIAIQIYAAVYAKSDKEFSKLLVESVVVSFVLVTIANWLWDIFTEKTPLITSVRYALVLLALAVLSGVLFAYLRVRWPLKNLATGAGFNQPSEDFIRSEFARLKGSDSVTVTLKNGEIFSGTPKRGSTHIKDIPREYYFNNIAWYDKHKHVWDTRPGGLIIALKDIAYIETP